MAAEKLKTESELMTLQNITDCNTFYLGCALVDDGTANCPDTIAYRFTGGGYGILRAYNCSYQQGLVTQEFIGIDADDLGVVVYATRNIRKDGTGGLWNETYVDKSELLLSSQYNNPVHIQDCNKFLTGIGVAESHRTLNTPQYESDPQFILIESFKVSGTSNIYMQRATAIDTEYSGRKTYAAVNIRYINVSSGVYDKWHPIFGNQIL